MARTKGAVSTILIPLSELKEQFGDSALIPVGFRFAKENHLKGQAIYLTKDNIKAAGEQPEVIEVKETE